MNVKQKLKRFSELGTFDRVIELEFKNLNENFEYKGNWANEVFKNNNPIVLELGCGKGEYTIDLAKKATGKNFIGVDIKGNRLWRGAKTGHEEGITNSAFLRTQIEFIEYFFAENEVSEIWITFPDPQLKDRREEKRLTHPNFLDKYHFLLNENGLVHLKTDSKELFEISVEYFKNESRGTLTCVSHDINAEPEMREEWQIETFYEQKFRKEGKAIQYLQFQFNS
ncbi:MAG: tRNA (guanosine(46)-N7)-methyltransferase TrmB [Bacteroidia bacterium]|nr:tRNA (guanosine(46)-N7)-methyltransferase TrmB [Bacteroidia bacterium]